MRCCRWTLYLCALLAAAGTLADEAAQEILKKADAAIKAVDAVRLEASATPSGIATNFFRPAEGEVLLIGWNGRMPEKFYGNVKSSTPDGKPVEVTGGGDGDSFFVIDHSTKKGYEDMDPGVMGRTGRALQAIQMVEFVHAAPFDDELGSEESEVRGNETIDGEECVAVHVVYGGGNGESTWYFSTSDWLPRRRVRHFSAPQGEGTLDIRISKLEVAPSYSGDLFRMKLPAGYAQIDDFAP